MHVDTCVDMYVDMSVDLRADMYVEIRIETSVTDKAILSCRITMHGCMCASVRALVC